MVIPDRQKSVATKGQSEGQMKEEPLRKLYFRLII
jgi:hypothetical protein